MKNFFLETEMSLTAEKVTTEVTLINNIDLTDENMNEKNPSFFHVNSLRQKI